MPSSLSPTGTDGNDDDDADDDAVLQGIKVQAGHNGCVIS